MVDSTESDISSRMVWLLAVACGLIVANLYYAQTLVGPISAATGLSPQAAGLIVTLTQIGYCLGLLFIVPIGDLLENRRLITCALFLTCVALVVAATSSNPTVFLVASLGVGLGSVAAQILVPFAAHLSKESTRGRTVGKVVSGLLIGIMIARPAASFVADYAGWHVVFGGAAAIILILTIVLNQFLPKRVPSATLSYGKLLVSMWHLFSTTPVLRRRAAYHAGLFGSFSLFWTTVPLILAGPQFNLSQSGIAIFALVGMAGAVASPVAGHLADAGHSRSATGVALALGIIGFALPFVAPTLHNVALAFFVAASIILDMAVAANLVLGQRAIFVLGAEARSRLNGLYFAFFFAGGALGSAVGAWMFVNYGWKSAMLTGMAFPGIAFLYWMTEYLEKQNDLGKQTV